METKSEKLEKDLEQGIAMIDKIINNARRNYLDYLDMADGVAKEKDLEQGIAMIDKIINNARRDYLDYLDKENLVKSMRKQEL